LTRRHDAGDLGQDAISRPGWPAHDGAARMPPPRHSGSEPRPIGLGMDAPRHVMAAERDRAALAASGRQDRAAGAGRARGVTQGRAVIIET
jgi:hypothetical protein